MRYGLTVIAVLICAVAGAVVAFVRGRAASRRGEHNPMLDSEEAKSRRIREIYDRAKAKLNLLRKQRRVIVERYVKKAEDHQLAEAKKRLEEI